MFLGTCKLEVAKEGKNHGLNSMVQAKESCEGVALCLSPKGVKINFSCLHD